jgi:hypothetical protein
LYVEKGELKTNLPKIKFHRLCCSQTCNLKTPLVSFAEAEENTIEVIKDAQ